MLDYIKIIEFDNQRWYHLGDICSYLNHCPYEFKYPENTIIITHGGECRYRYNEEVEYLEEDELFRYVRWLHEYRRSEQSLKLYTDLGLDK